MDNSSLARYCSPTFFIDSDHKDIIDFSSRHVGNAEGDLDKAVNLYYAVRDRIRYDPYEIPTHPEGMKASFVLAAGKGFCVAKAVLLAACLRSQAIPARLGFADVKNHLSTPKLRAKMGTDLFVWHGYTEVFLENRWVKATPAFNLSLCEAFGVLPLEFDGKEDSVFHPFDAKGHRHMEYVTDHGHFADLPLDKMIVAYQAAYPLYFKAGQDRGDFSAEARALKNS